MEGTVAFAAAFGLVFLLELGDKTQLATIAMASRQPWKPVLAGAATGLVAATALGAALGAALSAGLAGALAFVQLAGGGLLIALGVASLVGPREEEGAQETGAGSGRSAVASAFAVTFLAEMGDKTQITVIVLSGGHAAPLSVFAGAAAALVLMAALSVFLGVEMARRFRPESVRLFSAALLLAGGAFLVAEALWGA